MTAQTTAAGVRRPDQVLAECRQLFGPALRAAVERLPGSARRVAAYHFGWLDEQGQPASGGSGKAIRPALTLLAASAVGGSPATAVPAAVAVELAHNFSIMHDDVLDGDQTRRHRATAWAVFGREDAILTGSALFALALDVLAGVGQGPPGSAAGETAIRMLNGAVLDLLDGQSADLEFERRTGVDVTECLRMASAKTAALMGTACALGGLFGGADCGRVERLRSFGRHVGLAFQFADDLLGIWGDPAVTGKPVHSDLMSRKKSLPVVAALTSGTPAGAELAELYALERPLSAAELQRGAQLVENTGAREWSQSQAGELLARAMGDLASVAPAARPAAELAALARLAARRDH
ncbi:family 2 encapsulin nanocompartment cargo protein polyprenyl transferase [Flindersiella endophytica]